ncbi:HAD-IIB family hydrolase [Roseicyclus sp. F158]|uniref:sucrose-phosphate synthase n=1 Tax=Tropicimonas omnivorans TaxID=3075590 RepID=A0ABU3DJ66_9RHOB|nr:HAD-IIB family hydrolase [Roseicyclus sp. F158]MDT0683765.1 HAD-IIB family hydrolase [Roseicyclus sp. F158]
MHIALGGCLKAPPVEYGRTADTGGHIAYVLGAALAGAARPGGRSTVITRAIDAPALGAIYARPREILGTRAEIVRLKTANRGYLTKEALEAEIPSFTEALLAYLEASPRPDVIHAHFADAAEAALAARDRFGIPVIYTAHSLAADKRVATGSGQGLDGRLAREAHAIAEADAVIVSSRDEAERQIGLYPGARLGRVHRVMPGIVPNEAGTGEIARARALLAPHLRDLEKPLILAIARPVAKKNLPELVEIYARMPGLREVANLAIFAGQRDGPEDGPEEQRSVIGGLIAAVERHGLGGSIALPERHDPADVPGLYALAASSGGIFANPAVTEPFGLTLLEAAAAGLPVVATSHGGPRDIVELLGHGRIADPRDRVAFGGAMLELLKDSAGRTEAAGRGRRRSARWSWAHYAERHAAICDGLRRAPPPRPAPTAMLMSDIDNTLTGSLPAATRFTDWAGRRGSTLFAVATGRSLSEARFVLASWRLPEPDLFVTSVGSEIWLRDASGTPVLSTAFASSITEGWEPDAVEAALSDLPGLVPQPAIEARAWKRSYFAEPGVVSHVRRRLAARGLSAHVVHSHGRLLDILPERAGKGAALRWVREHFDIPELLCIAAGDSGNDLCLLGAARCGIVVANHSDELNALPPRDELFRAGRPYADGVLEGLARFGQVAS